MILFINFGMEDAAMSMKISVIVTVYNKKPYIKECLDSIMHQSYDNFEVIIVDDGSTDGSAEICGEYRESAKIIYKKNGGQTSARKEGLYASRGEGIVFVDADDWLDEDYIEKLVSKFEPDVDMVTSGLIMHEEKRIYRLYDGILEGMYDASFINREILPYFIYNKFTGKQVILHSFSNKLFKYESAKKAMEYVDETVRLNEDVLALGKLLLDSKKIVVTHYCGYNYRQHEQSISHLPKKEMLNNLPLLEDGYSNLLSNIISKEEVLEQLYENTMCFFSEAALADYNIRLVRRFITPWKIIKPNTKVAIYGAGIKGILYREEVEPVMDVVLWVDKNYSNIKSDYKIGSPQELLNTEYDVVLVAVEDAHIQNEILYELYDMGIELRKIWLLRTDLKWNKLR